MWITLLLLTSPVLSSTAGGHPRSTKCSRHVVRLILQLLNGPELEPDLTVNKKRALAGRNEQRGG